MYFTDYYYTYTYTDRFDKMKIIKQIKIDTDQILKTELEKFKNEYIIETMGN